MTIFLEIDCERQLMMTMRLVTLWLDQLQAAIAISRSCLNRGTIPTTIPGTIPTIIPGTIPSTTSSTIPVLPYLVPYPVPYLANITIPLGFMPYMLPYCWGQHVALEVHLEHRGLSDQFFGQISAQNLSKIRNVWVKVWTRHPKKSVFATNPDSRQKRVNAT